MRHTVKQRVFALGYNFDLKLLMYSLKLEGWNKNLSKHKLITKVYKASAQLQISKPFYGHIDLDYITNKLPKYKSFNLINWYSFCQNFDH